MNIQPSKFEGNDAPNGADTQKWPARLSLGYERKGDRTVVSRRHFGPLLIQRPFYPEKDGTCHNYILHPPGGVAGGDSLELDIVLEPEARCLLTAPGATKVYRSPDSISRQKVTVDVAAGAICELLPMELILFNAACFRSETEVRLTGDGVFFGWDLVSLGRPAANERFSDGWLDQRLTITRDGTPIWFERARIEGGAPVLDATHGLHGQPIFGTAVYAGQLPENAVDVLRERVQPVSQGMGAFTRINDVLVCRYIGPKVSAGRRFFADTWCLLREIAQNRSASVPRIWAT